MAIGWLSSPSFTTVATILHGEAGWSEWHGRNLEGMEHHISPQTFQAIEQLTRFLEKHPEVLARAGLPLKPR